MSRAWWGTAAVLGGAATTGDRSAGSGAARGAGAAAVLGGLGWLLLAPAAELVRRDLLGYDGYHRLVAVPLLLSTVALVLVPRVLAVRRLPRVGLVVAAGGAGLLLLGNGIEFYGVLLQDRPNAYAGSLSGQESWIGSHVGWAVFLVGALVLLVGSTVAALGLALGRTRPRWLTAVVAVLGIGMLAGSFAGLGPAYVSAPVLALYAAVWIGFGRWLRGADVPRQIGR